MKSKTRLASLMVGDILEGISVNHLPKTDMPKKVIKKAVLKGKVAVPKKAIKKAVKKVAKKKVSKRVVKVQPDTKANKKPVEKGTFKHKSVIVKNDPVRWNRIEDEIIVDAHDEEERAMGWYYAIADNVDEHDLRCRCRKTRSMSPLKVGEEVDVLEIAPGDDCEKEIFVVVSWNDRKLAVPLEQLEPISGDPKAIEVVEDWLYWCLMGYDF